MAGKTNPHLKEKEKPFLKAITYSAKRWQFCQHGIAQKNQKETVVLSIFLEVS